MRQPQGHSLRRRLYAAIAGGSLMLSLAACSPGAEEPAEPSDAVLTIPLSSEPGSLDPSNTDAGVMAYLWSSIYDTLLHVDNDGDLQPNAAESWQWSEDTLTLTLTLREGMTFSTGDPVTADAVKTTIEYIKATPSVAQPTTASVEAVEAVDDRTVAIHLNEPDPLLLNNLAQSLGVIADPATLASERTALDPVGSGPYVLDTGASVTGSQYVLQRRDDYWNAAAFPFATVTMRVITDRQAVFNALQAGEVDASNVQANQIEPLEAAGLTAHRQEALGWGGILILDRDGELLPALADVRVRQAINMAFDRPAYVEQIMGGVGLPTIQVANPYGDVYSTDLEDLYPFDPDGARSLLADAGYPDGLSVTMPSTYLSTAYEPSITQSLADIGIMVEWEAIPPQDVANVLASRNYPLAFWISGRPTPAMSLMETFGAGFMNPFESTTPELSDLFEQVGAVAADPDAQTARWRDINRYAVENALAAPLFFNSTTWMTRSGVGFLPESVVPNTLRVFASTE